MKKTFNWEQAEKKSYSFLENMTTFYIIFISVFLPLYYQKKYADIGFAKYNIFYYITWIFPVKRLHIHLFGFFPFMLIGLIIYLVSLYFQKKKVQRNKTDICVLVYGLFVIISTIFAEDKTFVINGYPGWHMGLIAQMSFILIYFFVSRFLPNEDRITPWIYFTAIIVFLLEILNRFSIDPLGMIELFDPLSSQSQDIFVSTIGNINWFCGYLMIIFPLWMYKFYTSSGNKRKIIGIFLSIGSMSLITQGSTGGLLAFLAVLAFMFYDALSTKERLQHFLEMIIMILVSWRIIGILRFLFPDNAVRLEGIFEALISSSIVLFVTGIVIAVYIYLKRKESFDYSPKILKKGFMYLTFIMIILPILYFILNNMNMLPEALSSDNQYFRFNMAWGTGRGVILQSAFQSIKSQPVWRLLIGNGPDKCNYVLYKYAPEGITLYWKKQMVVNVHNEFLTSVINYGIIGALGYFAAFVSVAKEYLKKETIFMNACTLSIIAYLVSGLISFQTIINGTFIFLILGIGRKYLK